MIFNLFKSKPTLKELIPEGFIDIHSHILPGIDDGAKNFNESKILIEKMKSIGFIKIIGTPHTYPGLFENTNDSIKNAFEKIKILEDEKIKINFASEYMLDESIIERARKKNLLCIKDNFLLVEMGFISQPLGLFEIIYEIKVNGYIPVLAHPERYLFLSLKEIVELKKVGCLLQANLLSLTNYYGIRVRKNLEKLINQNLIDFVGSDIHKLNHIFAFDKKVNYKDLDRLNKLIQNNNKFS